MLSHLENHKSSTKYSSYEGLNVRRKAKLVSRVSMWATVRQDTTKPAVLSADVNTVKLNAPADDTRHPLEQDRKHTHTHAHTAREPGVVSGKII